MESKVLVLGLGNVLLKDEGLGISALQLLQDQYDLPPSVQCADGGVLGLELLAYVEGVTQLLAIDAVQNGQPPGTLVRLAGDEVPSNLTFKLSMHQVRFADILALCAMRGATPPTLVVWGMVPEVLDSGLGLSPLVEERLEGLVEAVANELRQWGIAASRKPELLTS